MLNFFNSSFCGIGYLGDSDEKFILFANCLLMAGTSSVIGVLALGCLAAVCIECFYRNDDNANDHVNHPLLPSP